MRVNETKARLPAWLHLAGYIAVRALPALLTILFYALQSNVYVMDWASARVAAPIRGFIGLLSSFFPFSVTEFSIAAAGMLLIYYIAKTIIGTVRGPEKLKYLSKRLLTIAVALLYAWGLFCWLWNSGYHAPGFAVKNGFEGGGVAVEDLVVATALFAAKANEYAPLVSRDEDGHYNEDLLEIFALSTSVYRNIVSEFPTLEGRLHRPKPMIFSWLMSRTGYTGVYFALAGESSINIRAPAFLIPATIAHELAHQRGVFAEDEASFVGILACVTSGIPIYEYAGYLSGLIYLRNALFYADYQAWADISGSLRAEVIIDLHDNYDYWQSQKTVRTGIDFLDRILTSMTETLSDTVDAVYDGYLRSQNQELGIRSYGACVDLLVEYYTR